MTYLISYRAQRLRSYLLALLLTTSAVAAQQTTERFIPIGQSPGISGQLSMMGTVRGFELSSGELQVDGTDGRKTYRVTAQTRIWIDRSATRQASLVGNRGDLSAGRLVEVMHRRDDPQVADWIKLEAN